MAEALKTFREGEDILASETNENNQFLLSKLSDNAAQVQNYVEGEVATIKSNVSSVQATLQNNMDELETKLSTSLDEKYRPDYTRAVSFNEQTYTAPYDGIYYCSFAANEVKPAYCYVNDVAVSAYWDYEGEGGLLTAPFTIIVSKGDVIRWSHNGVRFGCFVPYKGSV
jgi:hypothetical protein